MPSSFKEKAAYKPLIETLAANNAKDGIARALQNSSVKALREASAEVIRLKHGYEDRWLVDFDGKGDKYELIQHRDQIRVYQNLQIENQIVDHDLCVRCGACEPACPEDIIRFDDEAMPYITEHDNCPVACNRCLKVCPGEFVDFDALDREFFNGKHPHPQSITGLVRDVVLTHASDEQIREDGTSGGFVTQLLVHLLETDQIDGALVLGSTSELGDWQEQAYVARSAEEIKQATRSKYMVTPFLTQLKEIEEVEGRYAVVALPCYVHAIRKYQKVSKKLRERITLVIGLFCSAAFRPEMLDDLSKIGGFKPDEIKDLYFRIGDWPGGLAVELEDGSIHKLLAFEDYRDEFNLLKTFHAAPRCNTCIDYTAEYADLTVADPWIRNQKGDLIYHDARSVVLTRTKVGAEALAEATQAGALRTSSIPLLEFMTSFEQVGRYKRSFVPSYIEHLRSQGKRLPDYNRHFVGNSDTAVNSLTVKRVTHTIGEIPWLRRALLRLAQSRLGLKALAWNRQRKDRRFSGRFQRNQEFAKQITPPKIESSDNIN